MNTLKLACLAVLAIAIGAAATVAAGGMDQGFESEVTTSMPLAQVDGVVTASASIRKLKRKIVLKPRRTMKRNGRAVMAPKRQTAGTAAAARVRVEQLNNQYSENMH